MAEVQAAFLAINTWQWAVALIATWVSFKALGRYDMIWHRALETPVCSKQAKTAGMTAVAVGQTLGLGTVTGAVVRWQLLPQLSLIQITQVSVCVSLSFMAAWAVLASLAASYLFTPATIWVFAVFIGLGLIWIGLRKWSSRPRVRMAITAGPHILLMAALDLSFAAIALWVLFPDPFTVSLVWVIAAYVLALGAGLISNTPGGAGAFDLALCTLLAHIAEPDILATLIAFRLVYYFVPALIGGGILLANHFAKRTTRDALPAHTPQRDLCLQGAKPLGLPQMPFAVKQTHLLGSNVIGPMLPFSSPQLQAFGRGGPQFRALYKCDERTAVKARILGWAVRKIAQDATLDPRVWTDSGSKKQQLRRKLKQAAAAGVTITCPTGLLPIAAMSQVAQKWAQTHGGELGYSMGRFTPGYLSTQRVYLIWKDADLLGFITAQTTGRLWSLDLIRNVCAMPSGAMQLAVVTMINDAKSCGVHQLSLGAVPDGPQGSRLTAYMVAKRCGLRQFKASFGVTFRPLYHVAPTRLGWMISITHATIGIQRPQMRARDWMLQGVNATVVRLIMMWKSFHLNGRTAHGSADKTAPNAPQDSRPSHDKCTLPIDGHPRLASG